MPESNFKKWVVKLKDQGRSNESARKIAASIGRKKYGSAEMAAKSAVSRNTHEDRVEEAQQAADQLRKHWMRGEA